MKKTSTSASLLALCIASTATLLLGACGGDSPEPAPFIPSTQVVAVNTPMPRYPTELGCAGIGGVVGLGLTIGVEGKPTEVLLINSSGHDALDKAAMEGVTSWKFEPATRRGKPVTQGIQVPVNFKPPQVRPDDCFKLDEQR
ncbi:MAG TPA: energy transducer TonB [Pseudoxanthomonas sp.]